MMPLNTFCNCISLRKASNNLTKIYDSALAKVDLKITQFSTLRNVQKLGKTNISDLSYLLELDRTTVLRNIEKLIKNFGAKDFVNENYLEIGCGEGIDLNYVVNKYNFKNVCATDIGANVLDFPSKSV